MLSNSTYSEITNVLSLPLRGNPLEIEYDLWLLAANTEGNGRLTSDWNIFGRPIPAPSPTYESSVTVKLQLTQTQNSKYTPSKIAQNTRTYVDRNYNFHSFPSWMDEMTFVQTANEDNMWPGKFDAYATRNLFCVEVDDQTTSSYVLMDQQAVYLPKWLTAKYKRLSDTTVLQQRSAWDEDRPHFDVWHRRLDGDIFPCFGMNGAEASAMYIVAFGDDPPTSTARFASASVLSRTTLDPGEDTSNSCRAPSSDTVSNVISIFSFRSSQLQLPTFTSPLIVPLWTSNEKETTTPSP